ncbi:hypothetical protein P170DRAFT_363959 [Aspergillus steynii IBT 23096]|uniref:LPXTG-motif cell wall anchor domain protein n=1 Tax=Aspergillus steynii IBT 23096 TaxID=1392250 RepID=A0A2I2FYJ3_9EURO|nr:uncharacterized protein P170DRAFT_363959 [Aspergillus steynii IBT 23096]PLB45688.1 hypothetical protein P170DRAFT_363959 [Aspergillus steynii IBT 23096]
MFGADPRDTTLTTSAAASFPSSPSASSSQVSPRVPQTRFNFEYQYPLRKRALTSHSALAAVDASPPSLPEPDPVAASAAASPITTPTPQRTPLYDRHRRSVPSFNFSQPHRRPAAVSSQPPSPRLAREEDSDSAIPLDATGSTVRVLSPNATKRRKQSFNAHQTPPNVKRRMPSSTVSYLQGRAPTEERAHRAVNGNGNGNGLDKYGSEDGARTPIADDSRLKNEDIFLNIARSDSTRRESFGRSDLRRSRFRMSGNGLRTPASHANEPTPSPDQLLRSSTYAGPLHSNNGSPSGPSGPRAYSYSVSEHPLEDHSRSHHSGYVASSRTAIGLPRSRLSNVGIDSSPQYPESNGERRASFQDSRAFRNSTLSTIRSSRQTSTSEATERARIESDRTRQDGTESTLSTTAPSTVWDELEDLKSRIRKLELTGKLPPSSQEAISSASADRPRTATTTVTTVSSSPNHGRQTSNPSAESDTITVPNPVHPLLQSAMAKAKTVLSKDVYTTLDVTVTDALALSNILHSNKAPSSGASGVNGYGSSDRQSRRKADSVCRSLTELCLALSDEQLRRQQAADHAKGAQPNGTAEESAPTPMPSQQPSTTTHEPEGLARRQSTRLTSRLEARRASLANPNASPSGENSSSVNRTSDSTLDAKQAQSPGSSAPLGRLNRLSTSLRMRRVQTEDENAPASANTNSPVVGRSISRSMTEIANPAAATHRSPRQRISYGYTSSQAPPDPTPDRFSSQSQSQSQSQLPQPRTPTVSQSGIPLRRSLMTPTNYPPATPRSNIQAGSRRYGLSSAATSFDSTPDDASAAPESSSFPAASSSSTNHTPLPNSHNTRIVAPSSKLAGSYTPIAQNRLRTNSLGTRRFGLRPPRAMAAAAADGAVNLDDSID